MKKLLYASLAVAVLAVASFSSCSKGSAGATGATGATGPAGPDSVYYSAWIPANFTGATDQNGDSLYYQNITCGNVTQGILDSGLIISYIGQLVSGTYVDVQPTLNYNVFEDFELSSVYFSTASTANGGIGTTGNGGVLGLRFIIIPGDVAAASTDFKGLSKTQIQTMSYDKINQILGNKLSVKTN